MKKILIVIVVFMLSVGGYAQKVTKTTCGAILDCSAFGHDKTTKVKKARTTSGSDTTKVANSADDIGSKISDEKIYYKFEVHKLDYVTYSWKEAIDYCASKTEDGGGWRMPTQKELIIIFVFSAELERAMSTKFRKNPKDYYRSASENLSYYDYSCSIYFINALCEGRRKFKAGDEGFVRCIRDI